MYWDKESKSYTKTSRIPVYTVIVFIITISALVSTNQIHQVTSSLTPPNSDMRPAFVKTFSAGTVSIKNNWVTGTGPNSFSHLWDLVKPQNISGTNYATTPFYLGSSTLITWIVTSGIVGMLLWIGLLIMIVWMMVRLVTYAKLTIHERFLTLSVVSMASYLLVCSLLTIVGSVIIISLALVIGLIIALHQRYINHTETKFSFVTDPRSSFFAITTIIICTVIIVWSLIVVVRQYYALHVYQLGGRDIALGAPDSGFAKINTALRITGNDLFHREVSQLVLGELQKTLNTPSISKETIATQVKDLGGNAITHTEQAITYDPYNVKNWINQGDAYRFMAKLGISGTYDKSIYAYHRAQQVSPHDITIDVSLAQLELAIGNTEQAKTLLAESINKQPTRDAYITRYQIAQIQKNMSLAETSLLAALQLDSTNPYLYYEYGIFSYRQGNYTRAAIAFNQTLVLDTSYAEAYFYLAVALEKSGNTEQAEQLITLLRKNNTDTDRILNQIRTNAISPSTELPVAETPKKQ